MTTNPIIIDTESLTKRPILPDANLPSKRQKRQLTLRQCFMYVRIFCRAWVVLFNKRCDDAALAIKGNEYRRTPNTEGHWYCAKCSAWKPPAAYSKDHTAPGGLSRTCRECCTKYLRQYTERTKLGLVKKRVVADSKKCTRCGETKSLEKFHKTGAYWSSYCKICHKDKTDKYRDTLAGSLKNALDTAKSRATKKGKICTLTIWDLLEMYRSNRGRCALSGLVMGWKPHSKNRISLERKVNSETYTRDNVVLIILRMNSTDQTTNSAPEKIKGSAQWNQRKFIEFHRGYQSSFSVERQAKLEQLLHKNLVSPLQPDEMDDSATCDRLCSCCLKLMPATDEYFHRSGSTAGSFTICHTCHIIKALLYQCKGHSVVLKQVCELTEDKIRALILKQNGLCHISNHELTLASLSDFQISVERLNNHVGYIDSNVVLVCLEFQTGDCSKTPGVNPAKIEESQQWTSGIFNAIFWPCGVDKDPSKWTKVNY